MPLTSGNMNWLARDYLRIFTQKQYNLLYPNIKAQKSTNSNQNGTHRLSNWGQGHEASSQTQERWAGCLGRTGRELTLNVKSGKWWQKDYCHNWMEWKEFYYLGGNENGTQQNGQESRLVLWHHMKPWLLGNPWKFVNLRGIRGIVAFILCNAVVIDIWKCLFFCHEQTAYFQMSAVFLPFVPLLIPHLPQEIVEWRRLQIIEDIYKKWLYVFLINVWWSL